jgi:hypothetical protein
VAIISATVDTPGAPERKPLHRSGCATIQGRAPSRAPRRSRMTARQTCGSRAPGTPVVARRASAVRTRAASERARYSDEFPTGRRFAAPSHMRQLGPAFVLGSPLTGPSGPRQDIHTNRDISMTKYTLLEVNTLTAVAVAVLSMLGCPTKPADDVSGKGGAEHSGGVGGTSGSESGEGGTGGVIHDGSVKCPPAIIGEPCGARTVCGPPVNGWCRCKASCD